MISKCLLIPNHLTCFINSYLINETDVLFCASGRIDRKAGNPHYKKMGMVTSLHNSYLDIFGKTRQKIVFFRIYMHGLSFKTRR